LLLLWSRIRRKCYWCGMWWRVYININRL